MATRAERFRAESERSRQRRAKPEPAVPGPRIAAREGTGEARRSANHQKAGIGLKAKQTLRVIAPQSRHDAGAAGTTRRR
jgi:hypothetical protein